MAAGASKSLPLQDNVINLNEWLLRGTTSSVSDETMQAFFVKSTYRGPTSPISLKNVHWTFFQALNAPEPQATLAGEGKWSPGSLKAFPSDRRERFRGRWAGRKAGSEEVVLPGERTHSSDTAGGPTSSDLANGSKLPARPPSSEPAASLPGEGFSQRANHLH